MITEANFLNVIEAGRRSFEKTTDKAKIREILKNYPFLQQGLEQLAATNPGLEFKQPIMGYIDWHSYKTDHHRGVIFRNNVNTFAIIDPDTNKGEILVRFHLRAPARTDGRDYKYVNQSETLTGQVSTENIVKKLSELVEEHKNQGRPIEAFADRNELIPLTVEALRPLYGDAWKDDKFAPF